MRYISTFVLLILGFLHVSAGDAESVATGEVDRIPRLHGVFRGRYEAGWDDFGQRFQVRNARVSLEGKILRELDYYFRVDLCDRGTMKFLDGWARWRFTPQWAVKVGRYRVPFGVDCFRGPGSYLFANRSFLGKYMANLRQVGLQLGYYGKQIPLTIEAGIFNSSASSDQEVWQKHMDYAAKAVYKIGAVSLSGSFLSMEPYGVRMNIADGAVSWNPGNLLLATEYQNMHYCDTDFRNVQAFLFTACYNFHIDWRPFNLLNIHGRYDYMGDYSNGKPVASDSDPAVETLTVGEPERDRITLGSTLACNLPYGVKAEIMLDYEHYFYHSAAAARADNRIVAELIVKF